MYAFSATKLSPHQLQLSDMASNMPESYKSEEQTRLNFTKYHFPTTARIDSFSPLMSVSLT